MSSDSTGREIYVVDEDRTIEVMNIDDAGIVDMLHDGYALDVFRKKGDDAGTITLMQKGQSISI